MYNRPSSVQELLSELINIQTIFIIIGRYFKIDFESFCNFRTALGAKRGGEHARRNWTAGNSYKESYRVFFLTGSAQKVSDYIVNPIKKVLSVRIYLLTGT